MEGLGEEGEEEGGKEVEGAHGWKAQKSKSKSRTRIMNGIRRKIKITSEWQIDWRSNVGEIGAALRGVVNGV